MQILNLAGTDDNRPGVRESARFDLQITADCRIYGVRLMEAPDGHRFVYGPAARGQRAATFSTDFAIELTREAITAYENFKHAA